MEENGYVQSVKLAQGTQQEVRQESMVRVRVVPCTLLPPTGVNHSCCPAAPVQILFIRFPPQSTHGGV